MTAALRAKGADVTGFDVSPAMVTLARERLGDDADLHVADLGEPLPFAVVLTFKLGDALTSAVVTPGR